AGSLSIPAGGFARGHSQGAEVTWISSTSNQESVRQTLLLHVTSHLDLIATCGDARHLGSSVRSFPAKPGISVLHTNLFGGEPM
ncbi:MAG TPA: hypothetical protein VGC53_09560, partial [Vicinamibacteria bacterium]